MAFIKNGDNQPIIHTYDKDGCLQVCSKCGKKMTAISINDEYTFVCLECDTEDTDL